MADPRTRSETSGAKCTARLRLQRVILKAPGGLRTSRSYVCPDTIGWMPGRVFPARSATGDWCAGGKTLSVLKVNNLKKAQKALEGRKMGSRDMNSKLRRPAVLR